MKKLAYIINIAAAIGCVALSALIYEPIRVAAQCNGIFPSNTLCGNLGASPAPPAAFSATTSVIGPGSSTVNDLAGFANTFGNQLKDIQVGTGLAVTTGTSLNLQPSQLATIGGVKALAPVTHKWFNGLDATGTFSTSQPAFLDLSGTIAASQYTDQQRAITSTYTVATSDCGGRIQTTSGFYTITLGAPSGFSGGCVVRLTNADSLPTGSNNTYVGAKLISVNGINGCTPAEPSTYLWPTQTMEVTNVNGSLWEITRCPGLWTVPSGSFIINVDPSAGSDTWGSADGLNTTTRAFATFNNAMGFAAEMFQSQFLNQTQLDFKCAASCVDNGTQIHWPPHGSPLNSQGRQGVEIDCNNGTLTNQVQLFFGAAVVFMQNCNIPGGVALSEGAELILNGSSNVTTPISGAAIFQITGGSKVFCNACTLTVSGGTGANLVSIFQGGGVFGVGNTVAVNQTGNVTWTDAMARVQASGLALFGTWTQNAHTTSGSVYKLTECGILEGAANLPAGTTSSFSCTQVN